MIKRRLKSQSKLVLLGCLLMWSPAPQFCWLLSGSLAEWIADLDPWNRERWQYTLRLFVVTDEGWSQVLLTPVAGLCPNRMTELIPIRVPFMVPEKPWGGKQKMQSWDQVKCTQITSKADDCQGNEEELGLIEGKEDVWQRVDISAT